MAQASSQTDGPDSSAPSQVMNSYGGLAQGIAGGPLGSFGVGTQVVQTDTMFANIRGYLISNNRTLLSRMYVEMGIVQTLVDQPVEDAFRLGFEIKTSQLDPDEKEQLKIFWERERVGHALMQAIKWARLFGGGAVMIITDQPARTPFDISKITEDSPIEFRATDMWELYNVNQTLDVTGIDTFIDRNTDMYSYYSVPVHPSRVYAMHGKEAPSFIRSQLRGWGMSEIERLVSSLNQYIKNNNVIFELLDEAKVDVYGIKGLNTALMNNDGTARILQRVQNANTIKSFVNALTMDVEDKYEQKQINFAGLSDILSQIRIGIAADLKMPVTKLFGISSAGFNSGEDDIENYNAMIESEIRAKVKYQVVDLLGVCCQKLFGIVPDDLMITWPSLRVLSGKEEEEVKDAQFNRVVAAYQAGLATPMVATQSINKNSLIPHEVDETDDVSPPISIEQDLRTHGDKEGM